MPKAVQVNTLLNLKDLEITLEAAPKRLLGETEPPEKGSNRL